MTREDEMTKRLGTERASPASQDLLVHPTNTWGGSSASMGRVWREAGPWPRRPARSLAMAAVAVMIPDMALGVTKITQMIQMGTPQVRRMENSKMLMKGTKRET
jgi:hypothetical protein